MFLMQRAVQALKSKEIKFTKEEEEALYIAILLHDIGHGPFSHAMEHSIVENVGHEQISLLFMTVLNKEFKGRLDLAIKIFKNKYHRGFMHQLVSGQLDMDRLDYLRRDSFYTGVSEGNISSQRLIAMLYVKDDRLVVEEKGIYSVEEFIIARRLMYWQVYLHKTSLVAEQLLLRLLKRAKEITQNGVILPASETLSFFLKQSFSGKDFTEDILKKFATLDDFDVISGMKSWCSAEDIVLSELSKMLLNRNLLKIKITKHPISEEKLAEKLNGVMKKHNLSAKEASYFVFEGSISNQAYRMDEDTINLIKKNGKLVDVAKASDHLNIKALSETVIKYYICYPKSH
jgi:hypothetical protein